MRTIKFIYFLLGSIIWNHFKVRVFKGCQNIVIKVKIQDFLNKSFQRLIEIKKSKKFLWLRHVSPRAL